MSRRKSLKGIAIGTVLGGATLGASSVAAGGDRDEHGRESEETRDDRAGRAERGGVELVPECAEPALDLAAFRVDNHTKREVTLEWRTGDDERTDGADRDDEVITFVDCHTVRIVGDFPEVVLHALELFETEDGEVVIGAIGSFPWGPVEGERTIDFEEELNQPVVVSAVDVLDRPFGEGGEIVHERLNPDIDRCIEELFADAGLEPGGDSGVDTADGVAFDDVPDIALPNRGTFTTAAKDSSYLVLRAPGGDVTVRLLRDGDEIARTASADTPCREKIHGNVGFEDFERVLGSRIDGSSSS
ncbi:hypothetical protein [Natronococcus wangiae]|uniref:hypothetical protein n=1 Tax=Natronococcus wangiae TaxID=3068275 RepID=UPI00273E2BD3|nr:hypothetical protein [Natronococcus sp. AD5]